MDSLFEPSPTSGRSTCTTVPSRLISGSEIGPTTLPVASAWRSRLAMPACTAGVLTLPAWMTTTAALFSLGKDSWMWS